MFIDNGVLLKMRKLILNNKGSSLVQVMVISGMVSVFGLAVMQTQKNVKSVQSSLIIRDSNNELKTAITALLKYPDVCVKNFDFFDKTTADDWTGYNYLPIPNLTSVSYSGLVDFGGNEVYREHNEDATITYFGKARIKDLAIGRYDSTRSLATLKVTLDNVSPSGNDLLHLGGRQIELDIPIRIFYDDIGTAVKRCMAEEVPIEDAYAGAEGDTQLAQLCTSNLGGSFYNGDCKIPEFVELKSKSRLGNDDPSTANICQNFGGTYVTIGPNKGTCTGGFMSGNKILCTVPGEVAKGFTGTGTVICGAP